MFCVACGARNPEDSNYCKRCGRRIEPDDADQAAAAEAPPPSDPVSLPASTAVIGDGGAAGLAPPPGPEPASEDVEPGSLPHRLLAAFRKYEEGDLSAAVALCARAVEQFPGSADAHALLSTLHEKSGNLEGAIAERERVLEITPGSPTDAERLALLRSGTMQVSRRHIVSAHPARAGLLDTPRGALAVAACVAVLVFSAAGGLLWMQSRQAARAEPGAAKPQAPVPQRPEPVGPQTAWTAQPGVAGAATGAPVGAAQPPNGQQAQVDAAERSVVGGLRSPANAHRASREQAGYAAMAPEGMVPPASVTLPPSGSLGANVDGRRAGQAGSITYILPDQGSASAGQALAAAAQDTAARGPGKIEIVVSDDTRGAAGSGGSQSAPGGSGRLASTMDSRSRRAIAMDLQMKGDYRRAAAEYLKSLDGAGDEAALIHQRIALCYQRLNEKDRAVSHYSEAVKAFREQKEAGRKPDAAAQGIKACEAGIQACK